MIEFEVKGITLRFSFLFFAMLTAVFLIDKTGTAVLCVIACGLHELGHIVAFFLLGLKPSGLNFELSGIRLTKQNQIIPYKKELVVLAAGCAVNFIIVGVLGVCNIPQFDTFRGINLTLGIFNILPIGELDGGRILKLSLLLKATPNRAFGVAKIVSIVFILPIVFAGIVSLISLNNITLLITGVYLAMMLFGREQL